MASMGGLGAVMGGFLDADAEAARTASIRQDILAKQQERAADAALFQALYGGNFPAPGFNPLPQAPPPGAASFRAAVPNLTPTQQQAVPDLASYAPSTVPPMPAVPARPTVQQPAAGYQTVGYQPTSGYQPTTYQPQAGAPAEFDETQMPVYLARLRQMESSNNYSNRTDAGPDPRTGQPRTAWGAYGVLDSDLPQWSKEAVGRVVPVAEFMRNPELQDQIAGHQFKKLAQQYGLEGAARGWLGGPGGVNKPWRTDRLGTSIDAYGQSFMRGIGQAGAAGPDVGFDMGRMAQAIAARNPGIPPAVLGQALAKALPFMSEQAKLRQQDIQFRERQIAENRRWAEEDRRAAKDAWMMERWRLENPTMPGQRQPVEPAPSQQYPQVQIAAEDIAKMRLPPAPFDYSAVGPNNPAPKVMAGDDVPRPTDMPGFSSRSIQQDAENYLLRGIDPVQKAMRGKTPAAQAAQAAARAAKNYAGTLAEARGLSPEEIAQTWQMAPKVAQWLVSPDARTARSLGVVIDHLDTFKKASDAFQRGDIQLINQLVGQVSIAIGRPEVQTLDALAHVIGVEIEKSLVTGATSQAGREEAAKLLQWRESPPQTQDVIKKLTELLAGQLGGFRRQAVDVLHIAPERFEKLIGKHALEALQGKSDSKADDPLGLGLGGP